MTFEEKLALAFAETIDAHTERLMNVKKKHRFSFSYRLWERKTLRNIEKNHIDNHWTLRKARYAVAAIAVVISLLIGGTVYAAYAVIGRYRFDDKADHSKLLIEAHPSDKASLEEYYGLPEGDGWELTDYEVNSAWLVLFYEQGDKKISFDQMIVEIGNMEYLNTEKADIEMLSIYSENDGFIMEYEDNVISLHWLYDGYYFEIAGNIDKKEAIDLARSTKIVEF